MSIELLAQQGRSRIYGGLASVEAAKLRQMRDSGLRACFARLEDTPYRMEFVAHIHEKNFVNDAPKCASRSPTSRSSVRYGSCIPALCVIWTRSDVPTSRLDGQPHPQSARLRIAELACFG